MVALLLSVIYSLLNNFVEDMVQSTWINIGYMYVSTMVMGLLTLLVFPWIVFHLVEWETNSRKSVKEGSFLSKHGFVLIFNMIMAPWISGMIYKWVNTRIKGYKKVFLT